MSFVHCFTTDWAYWNNREDLVKKINKEDNLEKKKQLEMELKDMDIRHSIICT